MAKTTLADAEERAVDLLETWAFFKAVKNNAVHLRSGCQSSASRLGEVPRVKAYRPVQFKKKTNAVETKSYSGKSKAPTAYLSDRISSKEEKVAQVDALVKYKFSEKQQRLLLFLFMPAGLVGRSKITDAERAYRAGYKPGKNGKASSFARSVKRQAIDAVVCGVLRFANKKL